MPQYLMEGLFNHGADQLAIEMMTAENDRSWRHMLNSGSTITWEAWDQKYKPNQDWNHPLPAKLKFAKGKIPTPRGPIQLNWTGDPEHTFRIDITLPADMTASVNIPAPRDSSRVLIDGRVVRATRHADRWHLIEDIRQSVTIVAE